MDIGYCFISIYYFIKLHTSATSPFEKTEFLSEDAREMLQLFPTGDAPVFYMQQAWYSTP